jgi:hypothetical protein
MTRGINVGSDNDSFLGNFSGLSDRFMRSSTVFGRNSKKSNRATFKIKLRYFYLVKDNNNFMRGLGSGPCVASLAKLPRRKAGATAVLRRKQIPLRASGVPDHPARFFSFVSDRPR